MLKILNRNGETVKALLEYWDYYIDSSLDLDDKTLYATAFLKDINDDVETEGYIETRTDRFVIKEIEKSSDDISAQIVAQLDMESLEGKVFRSFKSTEQTVQSALQLAFSGTGWTIISSSVTKKRSISMSNTTALKILSEALKVYRCEIIVDSKEHTIEIVEKRGSDKGAYFSSSLNLKRVSVQETSNDFYTEIEPYGKDGLTIADVNDGKTYLSNHQYSEKVKRCIWKDERYTNAESLKEDAEARLSDLSKPYSSYTVDILDLTKLAGHQTYDFLSFDMGDTITLMDSSTNAREQQRIVGIRRYPDEPSKDQCTLANKTLTFDERAQKYETTASTVDNITNDNGQVDGDSIDGIYSDQIIDLEDAIVNSVTIRDLTAQYVEVTGKLTAVEADIGTLNANLATIDEAIVGKLDADLAEITYAKIENLEATNAKIETLEAENATITGTLTAAEADIDSLEANYASINEAMIGKLDADVASITYATITDLNAAKADISVLDANYANIKTLLSGNAGIGDLQNIHLTSANAVIDSALIRNAVIETVTVNDLLSGTISTNKFTILSDNGGIRISGATQQWKDLDGNVRMQAGLDVNGDFTFSLFDESGTGILIDDTGIKPAAIADGIIVNDMVADNAAIEGSKLDIESVFTAMNGSTSVLTSNRIWFDDEDQSLTQIYSQMSNDIVTVGEAAQTAQNTAQSALNAISGISTLDSLSAVLTNDAHVVHTNTDGTGGNYMNCNTRIIVYLGDADVSGQSIYNVYPSEGVSGTWNAATRTYQVTNLTTDDGYVDIDALYGTSDHYLLDSDGNQLLDADGNKLVVRTGGAHLMKRFSISKAPDGRVGVSYTMEVSTPVLRKQQNGTLSPEGVTFFGRYNNGSTMESYSGRFKIEESTDGSTFVQKYLSSSDESQKVYVPSSSDILAIRGTLYQSGGVGELDQQTVILITDADGLAEEIDELWEGVQITQTNVTNIETSVEGIQANISQMQTEITGITDNILLYNVLYHDNENGTVTLTAKVYKNGQDVTNTFNSRWFTWYAKSEMGNQYIGHGYGITVNKNSVGFGSTYIGRFTTYDTYQLTTHDGKYLTTHDGKYLTVWVEN